MGSHYHDIKANATSLLEFSEKYYNEDACERALFDLKWPDGFSCPKCQSKTYSIIRGRRHPLYQCACCRAQTTAAVNTIMENTKLKLVQLFLALYFVATNKDGVSEVALAKYMGTTLKTAWSVLHKIRQAMGHRNCLYKLGGAVEMDEAFFGGRHEGKRGRGSENKSQVAVALQVDGDGHPEYLKMQVIPDAKGETLLSFAEENIDEGAIIYSDAFASYHALEGNYTVNMQKYDPKDNSGRLKWLHVMISNMKANIEGAYHGLNGTYLQRYLDEFCYRFNRRWGKGSVLDRLLKCCVWAPYHTVAEVCI